MGLGWLAGVAGSLFSSHSAKSSAEDQMSFQERMSSTAHQREVTDLRTAGLNPILSGMGGNGASSPVGAMYTTQNPTANAQADYISAKRYNEIEKGVASADISLKKSSTEKTQSDITVNKANLTQIASNVETAKTTQGLNSALASKTNAETAESLIRAKHIEAQIDNTKASTGEIGARTNVHNKTIQSLDAGIQLAVAQSALAGTQSAVNLANVGKIGAETDNIGAHTDNTRQDTRNKGQYFNLHKNAENYENKSNVAPYLPYAERLMDTFSPFRFNFNK